MRRIRYSAVLLGGVLAGLGGAAFVPGNVPAFNPGMTAEYKAGHYFKRLTMIDLAFGNVDHHLRALARMGGLIEASKPAA